MKLHAFCIPLIDNKKNFHLTLREEGLNYLSIPSIENDITKIIVGLPWWCSGWESACQCRGHGFEPWSGKIPHAVEQLGPWATTTEPVRLEPVLRSKRGCDSERPAHHDEEWPPLAATRGSPRTETKTQHSQKKKKKKKKKSSYEKPIKEYATRKEGNNIIDVSGS